MSLGETGRGFVSVYGGPVRLQRCPACGRENYAGCVLAGVCAWCDYETKQVIMPQTKARVVGNEADGWVLHYPRTDGKGENTMRLDAEGSSDARFEAASFLEIDELEVEIDET